MNRAILSGEMYITESGQILLADPELEVGGEWCRRVGADLCPGGGLGADLHLAALAAQTQGRGHADRGLEAGGYRQQGRSWWLEAGGQWRQGRREGRGSQGRPPAAVARPAAVPREPQVPARPAPARAAAPAPAVPGAGAGVCVLPRPGQLLLHQHRLHLAPLHTTQHGLILLILITSFKIQGR